MADQCFASPLLEEGVHASRSQERHDALEGFRRVPEKAPIKQGLKKAHWQYIYGMLSTALEKGDQKPFWCYIRSQMQDNQGVSPLLKGNQLQSDPATKGEILGQQFCSVITVNDPGSENIALEGPLYPMHEPHQSSQTLAYISS